jgi:hypothetical protein
VLEEMKDLEMFVYEMYSLVCLFKIIYSVYLQYILLRYESGEVCTGFRKGCKYI